MKLDEITKILNARVICGEENLSREISHVFASDLMSDVLTIDSRNLLLITGLTNVQTIRTSEMADIQNIVIVRNKKVTPEMSEIAIDNKMVILECEFSMFRACGILYAAGMQPVY